MSIDIGKCQNVRQVILMQIMTIDLVECTQLNLTIASRHYLSLLSSLFKGTSLNNFMV